MKMRVFIVDDSEVVRNLLTHMVSRLPNVEVVGCAAGVTEAIEAIGRLKPTIIVLDIAMPGGSGLEVLEAAKRETPSPIVMMFTNLAYEQYRERCQMLGADYFFDKSTEFQKAREMLIKLAGGDTLASRG
jgi:DNA-binding NarL/FixJ family response regulator